MGRLAVKFLLVFLSAGLGLTTMPIDAMKNQQTFDFRSGILLDYAVPSFKNRKRIPNSGDPVVVEALLVAAYENNGLDFFKQRLLDSDGDQCTALTVAASLGYTKIVATILDVAMKYAGNDFVQELLLHYGLGSFTPLQSAVQWGKVEVAKELLKTAFIVGGCSFVKRLLLKYVHVNQTALHYAVYGDNPEMIIVCVKAMLQISRGSR